MLIDRFDVLGIRVDATTPARAIELIEGWVRRQDRHYIVFCTVSSVLSARRNSEVKRAFEGAGLVAPDGMPLVWLGRRARKQVSRVYGPDFMLDLMEATGARMSHYFYGGAPGVAEVMADRLKERFPGLQVAGTFSPAFGLDPASPNPSEIEHINAASPDIVWIGLGHPKQDLWMHYNRDRIEAPILAAVGAAFDFHSGRVKEAPRWIKRSGFQWLHRLASDPRRLWRRYLIGNTQFILLLTGQGVLHALGKLVARLRRR